LLRTISFFTIYFITNVLTSIQSTVSLMITYIKATAMLHQKSEDIANPFHLQKCSLCRPCLRASTAL